MLFSSYDLTVTDKKVIGKSMWVVRVDLPIDFISAVGTGFFKSISISSPSGSILFFAIKNRNEIHQVVSDLIVERQSKN